MYRIQNPVSRAYADQNFDDDFSFEVPTYTNENGNCFFIVDFRVRIRNLQNYIKDRHQDLTKPIVTGDHRHRKNSYIDIESNDSEKQLLQFCKAFNLRILNRSKKEDLLEDFTPYNFNCGESTVDLSFISESFY